MGNKKLIKEDLNRFNQIIGYDQKKGLVKEGGEEYPEGWTDELEEIYKDAYYRYMDGYQGAKYYTREDILKQHLNNPKINLSPEEKEKIDRDEWLSGRSNYRPNN